MTFATADLIDDYAELLSVCCLQWRTIGGHARFAGPIRTLKVFEDNALVRQTLSQPGEGAVLVIDGGGSLRCALVGDQIGELAVRNGWAGIVVNGAVRDSVALGKLPIGLKALGTNPAKSSKAGAGDAGQVLNFGEAVFTPGHWLYSDEDGIVTAPHALI